MESDSFKLLCLKSKKETRLMRFYKIPKKHTSSSPTSNKRVKKHLLSRKLYPIKELMFVNTSFYKFFKIKAYTLKDHKLKLLSKAKERQIKGLALLGEEGLNASFCGKAQSITFFKDFIEELFQQNFFWKDSLSEKQSFKRVSVKIKKQIINMGEDYDPPTKETGHLSPQEWEEKLKENKSQVLDLRNTYETALGSFESATDLKLNNFQEFSQKLKASSINKTKETLIYCTGGIRCEKAVSLMQDQGFKKVYQLDGGILNYLKHFPHSHFKKDCFVFDHRVALDQNLEVSKKYALCPHCGQPGDLKITCQHCEAPAVICSNCNQQKKIETCSKNCEYHFKSGHSCKKKHSAKKHSPKNLNL